MMKKVALIACWVALASLTAARETVRSLSVVQHGQRTTLTIDASELGGTVTLDLSPSPIFALRAKDMIAGEAHEPARARFFAGVVRGSQGSWARLTRYDDGYEGIIDLGDRRGRYVMEHDSEAGTYLYRLEEAQSPGWTCATTDDHIKHQPQEYAPGSTASTPLAEITLACDPSYVTKLGGPAAAVTQMQSILNSVDGIYRDDFGWGFSLLATYASGSDPFPAQATMPDELNAYISWRGSAGTLDDLGQFWTALTMPSDPTGAAGIAYCPDVCGASGAASVCKDYIPAGQWDRVARMVILSAHEIGHQFSATHDATQGYIMWPANTYLDPSHWHFSDQSKAQINAKVATQSPCLYRTGGLNRAPVAVAGPTQYVYTGQLVHLDGTGSHDPDEDPIALWHWDNYSGEGAPVVYLDNTQIPTPTFTAPSTPCTLLFHLWVSDGGLQSDPNQQSALVTILVQQASPLTVQVGPTQAVRPGAHVALAASATGGAGPISWAWAQTNGTPVTLAGVNTSSPTFIAPDTLGTLSFQVTASDGVQSASATAYVVVQSATNHAPIANAGPDQIVDLGAPVTLQGGVSYDPDADPITYTWSQYAGPAVVLGGPNTKNPTFTAPATTATLMFELQVSDGTLASADQVKIIVVPGGSSNHPPVADAGANQSVRPGDGCVLNGSTSYDPDGQPLTYLWEQLSGPVVTITLPTHAFASFPDAPAGLLVFRLTVSDGILSASATTTVTVVAAVELVAISPASAKPGSTAVLWGHGFGTTKKRNKVYFGNAKATLVKVTPPHGEYMASLQVRVPRGKGTVAVTVVVKRQRSNSLPFRIK